MSEDVTKAADRLRRLEANEGEPWRTETYGPRAPFDIEDDRRTVTLAYLAEHKADDGEPITNEWMLACGFRKTEDSEHRLLLECGNDLVIEEDLSVGFGYGEFGDGGEYLAAGKPLKTRGDLRRLCAALGIPLAH